MIKSFRDSKLGALKALLSKHMLSDEVEREIGRYPSQTIIGLGQGGGRIAAELSRFGHPTYLLNSSKSDLEEHRQLIPENHRIVTNSEEYPELEGTDKNAQLGYEIAVENQLKYKDIALSNDVQDAEFVWVCVSLGGGTGNGALKVALRYLSRVRSNRALPGNKIPLGVICSVPSKDEKGSAFRRNAMAGIKLLQDFIDSSEIGSVLVIDNEKMKDYYSREPLTTYGGTEIDAKSYSNMVVASLLAEVSAIPLFTGRSVFDKTEFLSTISTPGWLSISRNNNLNVQDNLEEVIKNLFNKNEVLANYQIKNPAAGAIAVIYPTSKNISPRIADDVFAYTSDLLQTKVNLSISQNSSIDSLTLYGITVLPAPSERIIELRQELSDWERLEKQQEEEKKKVAASLDLGSFGDFFTTDNSRKSRKKLSAADFEEDFDAPSQNKKVKASDLDDLDF